MLKIICQLALSGPLVLFAVFGYGQWVKSELPVPSGVIIYDIDFESAGKGRAEGHILSYDENTWAVDTVIAGNNFNKAHFTKENEGWTITGSARIYRYDGNEWRLNFSTTGGKGLYTMNFTGPDEGFVSGDDRYIRYYR